ncbi:ly-6/neurotoxin-like protein 1 [Chanos chanos]|uniref:Ly-6/neurotoxin-like protein 1 n=1 Tax=Chanos chanos TaxID=29144 RepID=A0A6J2WIV0_CHACN|nr:ly-6/neurotoxin-like protein 1 [Chanos chanos]
MNKFLLAAVVVVASLLAAEALTCKKCTVGVLGRCIIGSTETCTGNDNNCYTGKAEFNITGALSFYSQGCIASSSCNGTSGTVLGVGYTVTRTCCNTDQCNGASSIQLPVTAALGAALLASVWGSYL